MKKHLIFFCLLWTGLSEVASAQTDTIHLPGKALNTGYLKPGTKRYQIIMRSVKAPRTQLAWYWLRDIRLEKQRGVPVFKINQHWYGSDTLNYRDVYSIDRQSDFGPIAHSETVKGKKSTYQWSDQRITGAGISVYFSRPNYNWNPDIETFEMLPLTEHAIFAINFYEAGSMPRRMLFTKSLAVKC